MSIQEIERRYDEKCKIAYQRLFEGTPEEDVVAFTGLTPGVVAGLRARLDKVESKREERVRKMKHR